MDRRRAAGLLLALTAYIATATAAPTASNHTALDVYDGAPDGCYYNFQHYGEGDRIMTNEPCLNCTCHNRMLMCYLRVCPFTKPIGQDCTIEKRADQCCPIVTCPDVPVDLLTSTTTSPAEYGPTGIGKLDKFGCSINGKYFSEGSKVPPTPNKPCEHCYCIRNMTTCVMQECTLHVDGCTPIYHKDVCCPVRYSCDHPEDEMPLLDDLSTTVRPTPGFLLTTTTISPVTQMSQDCVYDNRIFPDGALIKTEKACDHCYCMKGDIVCVVQECGTPMENEGKNCTALQPREGVCCPDTYICEGDESTTGTDETYDFTTHTAQDKLTTSTPPRRTSSEGSGYRIDDELPYTELPVFEPEIEGSGEDELKHPSEITTDSSTPTDDILASTEETHEYIPLTTVQPTEEEKISAEIDKSENMASSGDKEKSSEIQPNVPNVTTTADIIKATEETVSDKTLENTGSGELHEDISIKPQEDISMTPGLSIIDENVSVSTTEINKQNIVTSGVTEREYEVPITTVSSEKDIEDEKISKPIEQDVDTDEKTTSKLSIEHDITSAIPTLVSEESIETVEPTESNAVNATSSLFTPTLPIIETEITDSAEPSITSVSDDSIRETSLRPQYYPSSTTAPSFDDEFVTTELQGHDVVIETVTKPEYIEPQKHTTASTPMLEEIERDTTEYFDSERIVPSGTTQDGTFNILSTTISNDLEAGEKEVTKSTVDETDIVSEDYVPGITGIPIYDQQEITTSEPLNAPEISTEINIKDSTEFEQYSPSTTSPTYDDGRRKTTQFDNTIIVSDDDSKRYDLSTTSVPSERIETTTEPDKGLNTIPSDFVEEAPISPDVQKTTVAEEEITTESDLDIRYDSSTDSEIIPSKTPLTPDTSAYGEDLSKSTTESAFKKESYSSTEGVGTEKTTVTVDVSEEVVSTLAHDHSKSTESVIDIQQETVTTTKPKYTESVEETRLTEESSSTLDHESSTPTFSVSEKDLGFKEETTTSTTLHDKPLETTTVNQEENEIFNEPRIPGEGDCLLNGITYTNESDVPSTNKCQSGCKCISSIIKCDPIICSPPPEYMNNCETVYDTPNACCPTYICDHKTETIPPQSHNQMSGTEAPVHSTVLCHGDECEISEDKKQQETSSESCKSGDCADHPSNESKETSTYLPNEKIPEQPSQTEKCTGDKCTPILCTSENDCQASPVIPCEGEKCETTHDVVSPPEPQCANGEKCDTTGTQLPKETCNENEGCQNVPKDSEQECNEDGCKKIDTKPLDHQVPAKCTELDCEKTQNEIETSTILTSKQTSQETIDEDDRKTTVKIIETEDKMVTEPTLDMLTHETSGMPEPHEVETKRPSETFSTTPDSTPLITEFESEATTKIYEVTHEQEVTSNELPESNKPELSATTIKDSETKVPYEPTTEIQGESIKDEHTNYTSDLETKTKSPLEFITRETSKPDITYQETTSTKTLEGSSTEQAFTFETQKITESTEKINPEDATHVLTEESSTESTKTYTLQSDKITKPSIDFENQEDYTEIITETSVEPITTQESIKLPESEKDVETTTEVARESSTEPTKIYTTDETQDITKGSQMINLAEVMKTTSIENVTKPSKSVDTIKIEDFTTEMTEITKVTNIVDSKEHPDKIDHNEIASKPIEDIITESSTILIDLQSAVVTSESIEPYSTTVKVTEETGSEPLKPIGSESQHVPESTDSLSLTTEEILTKPSETISTESLEVITHESVTIPSTTSSTESQLDSESPDKVEHELSTITGTNTEQSFTTSHKSPEEMIHHDDTTSNISEESMTLPPKIDTTEHEIEKSTDESNYEYTTSEKPPDTFVTQPQINSEVPSEVDEKVTTSKISGEPETELPGVNLTEQQEITKSPGKIDHDKTTVKMLESTTELSFETEPQEFSKPPEVEVDQVATTPKISQPTEPHATKEEDISKTPEVFVYTTTKAIAESATEISPKETEAQPSRESELPPGTFLTETYMEIETSKPTVIEMSTKLPTEDIEKSSVGTEILETITTSQGLLTSESFELTTSSFIKDSKTTTQQDVHKETSHDSESQHPQTEVSITESPLTEQISTIEHDIAISEIPVTSDSEKIHAETTPGQEQLELQTTAGLTDVPQPDLQEPLSTQLPTRAPIFEDDNTKPYDFKTEVPTYIPTDELRTTSSEIQDLTTPKPTELSFKPHDMETKTEHPASDKAPEEHLSESSTEQVLESAEKPGETKTEKPSTVTEGNIVKETQSQISSDGEPTIIQEENYTEESIIKYSSPEPTVEYHSTKAYPDEDTSTIVFQEAKEPVKPVDGLIQSLVTGQYEITTKPSDLEKDSHQTNIPIQISSKTPESDTTQSYNFEENATTLSSKLPGTTQKQSDAEPVLSTEYAKPIKEDESRTESPSEIDKTATKSTTEKEHLFEETIITQKPFAPEENEIETGTISEHEFTTKSSDTSQSMEVATETIVPDMIFTEKQESAPTEKPSVDIHELSTKSPHTTEAFDTIITKVEEPTVQDQKHTEPGQEDTKVPDIQPQKQTESYETVSAESTEMPVGTEAPTSESVIKDEDVSVSSEKVATESLDFSKHESDSTTVKPSVETESPAIEPTTASKHDYPESTTKPDEEAVFTDKMKEESTITPARDESTTTVVKVTETSGAPHSSEVYTEIQPQTTQTVIPMDTLIKEYLTTEKQLEPEIYQTTLSSIQDVHEKTTSPSVLSEEESTTIGHEASPNHEDFLSSTKDQSVPGVFSNIETSTPNESIAVYTERVISASEKPLQETTALEEEYMLATSKPTTEKTEEEIYTLSPTSERTARPTDVPIKLPITTSPEATITVAPETPITTGPDALLTAVPEAPLTTASEATSPPETITTKTSETPSTIVPEVSVTKSPEVHVTKVPEFSSTIVPEPLVTSAPELPKPVSTEAQPIDEAPAPDEESSFSSSGGSTGYGPEPEYEEEDQTFGPGTCRYGGKVYVSAQQIPRDDPCDFCFCFRSDIICLQQSCPPPIHGCHEEPIQGFCCPRYECPVSMATTVNVTTTTTTTTTTLPPHFPTHSYKGSVQKRGCQIKGQTYKVGDVVRASSGPCLHCTCGGDGQMKCDPKVCTPEPMLRQMIAAAVSAKRRR